jgi:hypothetical protein
MNTDLTIKILYRARCYFNHKYCTWYESCPVTRITSKFITVTSGDYPNSPLYKGGTFNVNRASIESTGMAYHSRHGEYFYLTPPEIGDLFPSKDVMSMPDVISLEAQQMGWVCSIPYLDLNEWQKDCWLYASITNTTLRQAVDLWKSGKLIDAWNDWKRKRNEGFGL